MIAQWSDHRPTFPASRKEAREKLAEFLPKLPEYGVLRNHVRGDFANVSGLSPAIRHRLILEEEVVAASLEKISFGKVEKWIQEIHWRTYWKGWLEKRPEVWRDYQRSCVKLEESLPQHTRDRARAVAHGHSGVGVMDRFARELLATGYLHNHARMWWASFWIHVERLPWQLGAKHFFDNLLDADPASNTLGWRWVAGLQTRGKTYLVRRSNLEKYCEGLESEGLERLDDDTVTPAIVEETDDVLVADSFEVFEPSPPTSGHWGLWLHEDDLFVESGPWSREMIRVVFVLPGQARYGHGYHRTILADAMERASNVFQCPVIRLNSPRELTALAADHGFSGITGFLPFVGPAREVLQHFPKDLATHWIRRPWDQRWFPLATKGYFPFWEKVKNALNSRP